MTRAVTAVREAFQRRARPDFVNLFAPISEAPPADPWETLDIPAALRREPAPRQQSQSNRKGGQDGQSEK
jgi:hypothetical protein